MNLKLSEDKLYKIIQRIVSSELDSIKKESEEWGLGEAYEMEVLDSIEKIVVDRVVTYTRVNIYVNLYVNSESYDYDDVMSELNYRIQEHYIPNSFTQINSIISI